MFFCLGLPAVADDGGFASSSPVFRKWTKGVPDVGREMREQPSFRTRLQAGYGEIGDEAGWVVGVEDLRLGRSPVMLGAQWGQSGAFRSRNLELRSYLRPLGSAWNLAPTVGYQLIDLGKGRWSSTDRRSSEGLALGGRLMVPLSRGGGADLAVGQRFIVGGGNVTTVGVGYAVSDRVRLATEFQRWRSAGLGETRGSLMLEWMP
ncbi:MAG: hypothetical protein HC860_21885 [Alkalinema sp. RU_4_3]|nr:hypothetical protein [Alkalinema sp. RU_4_3]